MLRIFRSCRASGGFSTGLTNGDADGVKDRQVRGLARNSYFLFDQGEAVVVDPRFALRLLGGMTAWTTSATQQKKEA
jgi:hypothetical protein